MIEVLRKAIGLELKQFRESGNLSSFTLQQKVQHSANTCGGFKTFPIIGALARTHVHDGQIDWAAMDASLSDLKTLEGLLDGQTSETIDDFIVENPSYALHSKIGIASAFMKRCYDNDDRKLSVRTFQNRYCSTDRNPSNRNWIHLLINIVRQGIREHEVSAENKIKIITFNYDSILEYVLENQFSNTERRTAHYSNYIDIIHVHGQCGDLTDTNLPAKTCLEWAQGIHVVNEPDVPENVQEAREKAAALVKHAEELYFCGFSFAGPNCRLLGLDSELSARSNRMISICNYDGNVGISKTVRKYEERYPKGSAVNKARCKTGIDEIAGTRSEPVGVSDWLKIGALGELPG